MAATDMLYQKQENQHLIFTLEAEHYAVPARLVREIICLPPVTRVPDLPDFFKGVINLRGTILPVLDLKLKFGMPGREFVAKTCVIIVELEERLIGMIVDAVNDVVDLPVETIAASPDFGREINTDYIDGLGKLAERLVIILNVSKMLNRDEVARLHQPELDLSRD